MQAQTTDIPRGVWLGASIRLGYPVPADEPYPHLCTAGVQRRDCAACAEAGQREAARDHRGLLPGEAKFWDY